MPACLQYIFFQTANSQLKTQLQSLYNREEQEKFRQNTERIFGSDLGQQPLFIEDSEDVDFLIFLEEKYPEIDAESRIEEQGLLDLDQGGWITVYRGFQISAHSEHQPDFSYTERLNSDEPIFVALQPSEALLYAAKDNQSGQPIPQNLEIVSHFHEFRVPLKFLSYGEIHRGGYFVIDLSVLEDSHNIKFSYGLLPFLSRAGLVDRNIFQKEPYPYLFPIKYKKSKFIKWLFERETVNKMPIEKRIKKCEALLKALS